MVLSSQSKISPKFCRQCSSNDDPDDDLDWEEDIQRVYEAVVRSHVFTNFLEYGRKPLFSTNSSSYQSARLSVKGDGITDLRQDSGWVWEKPNWSQRAIWSQALALIWAATAWAGRNDYHPIKSTTPLQRPTHGRGKALFSENPHLSREIKGVALFLVLHIFLTFLWFYSVI